MAVIEEQEKLRQSALNAKRNRKFQQDFRGDILQRNQNNEENPDVPEESVHKNRLSMLQAQAGQANEQAGGALGASVGGTFGSIVPVVGTGIGIFLGRYFGKKWGITGIIIFVLLMLLFFFMMFIAILKGMCETEGLVAAGARAVDYFTTSICPSLK